MGVGVRNLGARLLLLFAVVLCVMYLIKPGDYSQIPAFFLFNQEPSEVQSRSGGNFFLRQIETPRLFISHNAPLDLQCHLQGHPDSGGGALRDRNPKKSPE